MASRWEKWDAEDRDEDDRSMVKWPKLPTLGETKQAIAHCPACGCSVLISKEYVRPFMGCNRHGCPSWDFDRDRCICDICPKVLRKAETGMRTGVYGR